MIPIPQLCSSMFVSQHLHYINICCCISVLAAPRVELEKGPTFVEENTTVTLPKCHVTGSPTPEVKWSKVGGSLPAHSEVEDGQMKIVNATKQDAGLYKCEATNSVGSDEAETSVEVVEFVKPQEILNTTSGEDERVKCHVTTKSELQTIKWTKLNSEVPSLTDGTLQLTNIQDSDAGKYTCIVSVGKLIFVAEMQLNIRGTYRRDMWARLSLPYRVRPSFLPGCSQRQGIVIRLMTVNQTSES